MATRNDPGFSGMTVAGLFDDCAKAQQAISDLRAAGFAENQIGLARAAQTGEQHFEGSEHHDDRSVWDKVKSAFGGEDTRSETAYRDDDYSYDEDFSGNLSTAGLTEDESRYFSSRMSQGRCLVTVRTSADRRTDAAAMLERNGADLGSRSAEFSRQPQTRSSTGEQRIQLLGEMLRVHKERVARGEVRIRKEVVTENRNIQVPVTREELVIERTNVTGTAPTDARIGEDKEIRVPLSEEKVRVDKETVVTGEVEVSKRQVTDTRNISDTVRREELDVKREGDVEADERDRKKSA